MSACEGMDVNISMIQVKHEAVAVGAERLLRLLSQGQMKIVGQVLSSSNLVLLTSVEHEDLQALAIYKPRRGERPLWDFPRGTLCLREVTAYVVSQALGWPLVPPTVLRDGPYGSGALQLYVDADPEANYFTFREKRVSDLLPIALFDVLVNNADRKGGHLLLDAAGRIWAIDNALTFHRESKLRTVIWDFAGWPVPEQYLDDVCRLRERLAGASVLLQVLTGLLTGDEIVALRSRLDALLESPVFPHPDSARRHVPWPMV